MPESLITVERVDKIYRMYDRPRSRLTAALANRLAATAYLPDPVRGKAREVSSQVCREFFALQDVSFQVEAGESLGIIGRNGSGKSTLLKIIAGTLPATRGKVRVHGRVAAMLELAAGFEREFTGRENVFLSAAILGLSDREIRERYEGILAFADIGDFIDQPVKTYSSGMMVRLAFAVHTAVDPEILIIDEALSVGDEPFRRKCFARLDRLREEGTTLLFVSHDLTSVVNLTERALFFHQGAIVLQGRSKEVVTEYQRFCHAGREESLRIIEALQQGHRTGDMEAEEVGGKPSREEEEAAAATTASAPPVEPETVEETEATSGPEERGEDVSAREDYPESHATARFDPNFVSQSKVVYARHGGEITDYRLLDEKGRDANMLHRRRPYVFEYKVRFDTDCEDVVFAMLIKSLQGIELGGSRTHPWDTFIPKVRKGTVYLVRFRFDVLLMPGVYFLNAGAEGVLEDKRAYIHRIVDALPFRVLREENLMPTGLVDFRVEPEMRLVEDSLA